MAFLFFSDKKDVSVILNLGGEKRINNLHFETKSSLCKRKPGLLCYLYLHMSLNFFGVLLNIIFFILFSFLFCIVYQQRQFCLSD